MKKRVRVRKRAVRTVKELERREKIISVMPNAYRVGSCLSLTRAREGEGRGHEREKNEKATREVF